MLSAHELFLILDHKQWCDIINSHGILGMKGNNGSRGFIGPQGMPGNMFVFSVHSQSNTSPSCPINSTQLWTGYSLAFTDGNGYGHGQDLGKAGSCVQQFHPLPFVMCQGRGDQGTCNYAFRNEYSYWLSTMNDTMYGEVPMDETEDFISRCAVCKVNAAVVTVHSMTDSLPNCPDEWLTLWEGYSYLMVSLLTHVNTHCCI